MQRDQIENRMTCKDAFMRKVAGDIVRLADASEGLPSWLKRHSGCKRAPSRATRLYALGLYGDTDNASLFNACLILEVDKQLRAA